MINSKRRLLLAAASAAVLAGCDVLNGRRTPVVRCDYSTSAKLGSTKLIRLFEEIARELCQSGESKCGGPVAKKRASCAAGAVACEEFAEAETNAALPLLVADFVQLETLTSDSDGLVMGELLRTSLSKVCCRNVIQAEVGKEIRMSDRGVVTLTRNTEKARSAQLEIKEVVVGTYHNYAEKLILSVKLIDTSSQTILASVSRELVHRCDKGFFSAFD